MTRTRLLTGALAGTTLAATAAAVAGWWLATAVPNTDLDAHCAREEMDLCTPSTEDDPEVTAWSAVIVARPRRPVSWWLPWRWCAGVARKAEPDALGCLPASWEQGWAWSKRAAQDAASDARARLLAGIDPDTTF